ncbi:riboflavin synthase [Corynebacterium testudinoris]|uniref:Riboflavin synthase n=1 Tax=Corynebacterium testudinoris TaxID=136857 RepID=A0A0G3H641_9CORY|nr:riboflavin synthase [Corynebacterium testudinoris]AKK08866.1 riboflavin synthase alpha chain [Corynebacterium testudinoris]MBX8994921.1 riboflavin synthase [Corynebacterium testudinoris]
MFTGLVEEIGTVAKLEPQDDALRVTIAASTVLSDAALGASIAVNGVCLTVAELGDRTFTADVMQESLNRTSLGGLGEGSRVNLERALAAGARLGGHIMQGHVDGTATLLDRTSSENWDVLRFSLPPELSHYVVEKGSIAVNGTSLTVSAVGDDWFEVSLIPTTLAETTHGELAAGDTVNLEVDVLAKYVERMLAGRADGQSSPSHG